MLNAVFL